VGSKGLTARQADRRSRQGRREQLHLHDPGAGDVVHQRRRRDGPPADRAGRDRL